MLNTKYVLLLSFICRLLPSMGALPSSTELLAALFVAHFVVHFEVHSTLGETRRSARRSALHGRATPGRG